MAPVRERRPDAGRAARFPRGHCGRAGCRCTHSHGCDHGWIEAEAYSHRGVSYAAPQDPCPTCRPELLATMLAGSITPAPEPEPERVQLANPEPGLAPLWGDDQ